MRKICFAIICVLILLGTAACRDNDAQLAWAQSLKASDVARIEIVRLLGAADERYKDCEKTEFERIVSIINGAKGKRVDALEGISGGTVTVYITLNDGTRHTFANNGNVYLVIDGVSFEAKYEWLNGWSNEKTNGALPQDFVL